MDDLATLVSLLEKMGDSCIAALLVDASDPLNIQHSSLRQTGLLTTSNDPLDAAIKIWAEVDWPEQRFGRCPPQHRRNFSEYIESLK
jgi:hypothetical protein